MTNNTASYSEKKHVQTSISEKETNQIHELISLIQTFSQNGYICSMANKDLVLNNEHATLEQKTIGLISCVAQEIQAKYIKALLPWGVSPIQLNILHVLDYGPKEGLTVSQIKKLQVEESPNISRALNKLMDKGYIIKNRNKIDQRVVHIQITNQGRKIHKECDEASVSLIKLNISDENIETLFEILKKL